MTTFIQKSKSKLKFLLIRIIVPAILGTIFTLFPRKKKTLLVIKNDGIGDYILFRNYLKCLKNSEKYRQYKIYLLGNISFKDIAVHLDSTNFVGFYWYHDSFFLKWDLIKLLFSLQKLRPQTIIYTSYSRKFPVDRLISHIAANQKIAIDGDTLNETNFLKNKANNYYNQLIKISRKPLHEFDRNKQIVEAITGEKYSLTKPVIDKNRLSIKQHNKIIVFLGGSEPAKRWSSENFSQLCMTIVDKLNSGIALAGDKNDIADAEKVKAVISSENISDETGQLSLIQLCELIGGAKLLVSNDTVAVHIAVALDVPVVCIARGDLYGRFVPYPPHIYHKMQVIFPAKLTPGNRDFYQWSTQDINDILPGDVYSTIESLLSTSPINTH